MDVSPRQNLDEVAGLRRTMRDLVALSALAAVWTGSDSAAIAQSLADCLLKMLSLELVYVRIPSADSAGFFETARWRDEAPRPEEARTIGQALAPSLNDSSNTTAAIPHPRGPGTLHIAITRFGYGADAGVLVGGCAQADFPSEQDGLLLSVGANQAAIAMQRNRGQEERLNLLEREREAHQEAQTLNAVARDLASELNIQSLVQKITDAGVNLTGARFGAFFYNAVDEHNKSYVLYTLSGAPREAFEEFGVPRNTEEFGPTFQGEGVTRIADVLKDPRFGKSPPHFGLPKGHLPVRSYLAVPVFSSNGSVLGGFFFGHPEPGVFTERAERLALALAAQGAAAINNAELYRRAQTEIAERRRAEESERAARTQAERASRMRDEFLATVSHELRTPLNSVLGWTQLLRRTPQDQETLSQALEAIERGARSQLRLIEDLLDVSRIISGKLRLEVQTVDLAPLVQAAIEIVQPAAAAKEIRIDRVLDPQAGPVKGDPARLQQIFWNLLSNAVKFTSKGGTVQIHLERVNSHVEVCVTDTGRGIDPGFLLHVFDRFSQADGSTTRRHGGLGLGLAVVKHLVELHGGKVSVSSPGENQGATFTVHFPIAIIQQDTQGREHPISPKSNEYDDSLEVKLTDIRILVVDDDPDACEMLRRVLQNSQANVSIAHSAREALRIFPSVKPQIIISDIGMPEMDGYELIRQLRSSGKKIPAVAVTAFARSEDRIRALQAGYNLHVAKPLEPREIVTVVAALVGSIGPQ
ncbi:MAG TPA: ATP-binding protein [Tepidisphaeraceae bacterium]|jgi:signal transduction histidine kinase/ActR/RegA family two-component response regulator|nr:ATP-binding protein [Tepidisphaeraceae bacterium]